MGSRMVARITVIVAAASTLLATADAWAVKEPAALVSAKFDLIAQQPYVQLACPYPDLYDELQIHLLGTETDTSYPPHQELTGNLDVHLYTDLNAFGEPSSVGRLDAVLTDPSGAVLYKGSGRFAGRVNSHGHVVGAGFLVASLYENGKRTAKQLLANLTLDQDLGTYNVTGNLGGAANGYGWAV